MSAISVRNVWVEYGDQIVLERINLEIAAGTFLSVVGPSGAGKSTFLRLILGQERPARGTILLDGTPLPPEPGPDRGVVFQRYSVFPHLTVLQNVMLGRASWMRLPDIVGVELTGKRQPGITSTSRPSRNSVGWTTGGRSPRPAPASSAATSPA